MSFPWMRWLSSTNGTVLRSLNEIACINGHGASEGKSQELSPARLLPDPAVTPPRLASAPAQQGASVIAKEEAGLAGIVLPRFGGHVANAAELLDECWAELGNSTGRGLEPNEARRLDDSGSTTAARQ